MENKNLFNSGRVIKSVRNKIQKRAYFNLERFWRRFILNDLRFYTFNFIKKGNHPLLMATAFVEKTFQKFFYILNIIIFAQTKRFKNPFMKMFYSAFNNPPHLIVGHASVWHGNQKLTIEGK